MDEAMIKTEVVEGGVANAQPEQLGAEGFESTAGPEDVTAILEQFATEVAAQLKMYLATRAKNPEEVAETTGLKKVMVA